MLSCATQLSSVQNRSYYRDNWLAYDTLGRLHLLTGLGGGSK